MLDQRGQEAYLTRITHQTYGRTLCLRDEMVLVEGVGLRRVRGFNQDEVAHLESKLAVYEAESNEDVVLRINSRGGFKNAAEHLASVIQSSTARVIGLVTDQCRSSAFYVLQHTHLRLALPSSTLALHDISRKIEFEIYPDDDPIAVGKAVGEIVSETLPILAAMRLEAAKNYQKRFPHLALIEILDIMRNRKREFNAEEALKFGFIDCIVPSPPST